MTAASAVWRAIEALGGGTRSTGETPGWLEERYPGRWRVLGRTIADLDYPGNDSSGYAPAERFLERLDHGQYGIRQMGEFSIPTLPGLR